MSFFNEFPHTRTYDSDLSWLIKRVKELYTRFEELDNIVVEINRLMQEIRDMMSALEMRVEEIAKEITEQEVGKYLLQNAIPVKGYENINSEKSKIVRGSNGWTVNTGDNFDTGGFQINTTGSGSNMNAYVIAFETYDRFLFYFQFPAIAGTTGLSTGSCRISFTGNFMKQFNNDFKIDWNEVPVIYGNINPQRYGLGGGFFNKSSNTDDIINVQVPNQVTKFTGTVTQFCMNVKKLNKGYSL